MNLRLGDLEEEVEKSEEAMGKEIESWVVEYDARLDRSSSRSDQESLVLGHSSKKGRRNWLSCFAGCGEPNSVPTKECCCCCFDIELNETCPRSWTDWGGGQALCRREGPRASDGGNEDTWDGIKRHEPSIESIPRCLVLPEVSEKKLCSSAPGLTPPQKYLQYADEWIYADNPESHFIFGQKAKSSTYWTRSRNYWNSLRNPPRSCCFASYMYPLLFILRVSRLYGQN